MISHEHNRSFFTIVYMCDAGIDHFLSSANVIILVKFNYISRIRLKMYRNPKKCDDRGGDTQVYPCSSYNNEFVFPTVTNVT